MKKKDTVYLKHILQSITKIQKYTEELNEQEFLENQLIKDAVVRNFEIIGEATKKVSGETRSKYPIIEWRKMAGMRDKLIHDYLEVDYEIVWYTITEILMDLKIDIEGIIEIEK